MWISLGRHCCICVLLPLLEQESQKKVQIIYECPYPTDDIHSCEQPFIVFWVCWEAFFFFFGNLVIYFFKKLGTFQSSFCGSFTQILLLIELPYGAGGKKRLPNLQPGVKRNWNTNRHLVCNFFLHRLFLWRRKVVSLTDSCVIDKPHSGIQESQPWRGDRTCAPAPLNHPRLTGKVWNKAVSVFSWKSSVLNTSTFWKVHRWGRLDWAEDFI